MCCEWHDVNIDYFFPYSKINLEVSFCPKIFSHLPLSSLPRNFMLHPNLLYIEERLDCVVLCSLFWSSNGLHSPKGVFLCNN